MRRFLSIELLSEFVSLNQSGVLIFGEKNVLLFSDGICGRWLEEGLHYPQQSV
jgi:hypothetical protein